MTFSGNRLAETVVNALVNEPRWRTRGLQGQAEGRTIRAVAVEGVGHDQDTPAHGRAACPSQDPMSTFTGQMRPSKRCSRRAHRLVSHARHSSAPWRDGTRPKPGELAASTFTNPPAATPGAQRQQGTSTGGITSVNISLRQQPTVSACPKQMLRPVFPRTPGAANTICAIRSGRALAACRPGTLLDRGPCGHLHLQRCQRCLSRLR